MEVDSDALIARLRERAGDPERRRDARPTRFDHAVAGLAIGELRLGVESATDDLTRLVASIRTGSPIDPALHERAQQVKADMSTPAVEQLRWSALGRRVACRPP